jgi:kynurenine formamidase
MSAIGIPPLRKNTMAVNVLRRFVDLSIYLENDVLSDPPALAPKITYQTHQDTIGEFTRLIPGTSPEDYPEGEAAAAEWVSLSTHSGTHLDAPYHFHSTQDARNGGSRPSITIDEVPLEWCFQNGVKLDFRHFPDGYVVTAADVEAELERIGYDLQPLDIVVVNTRAGMAYGQPGYVNTGCGMGYEATMYLLERGVRLTGTDAWSWDAPFSYTAERIAATGDTSLIWEGHKAGRDIGYCHLEKLHNLEALPSHGFMISCFPHKIRGASAGWTRAVAIFDDEQN